MEELEIQDQSNQPPPRHHHRCHQNNTSSAATQSRASHARTKTTPPPPPMISSDDKFECSVKSCAAATIADCVALCCCPCAVVNLVAFALLKVPWTVGKRCLAAGKTSLRNRRKMKKKEKSFECVTKSDDDKNDVVYRGWWTEEGIMDISSSPGEEDHERVWLELCQLGHLGFGRVSSFTGINPQIN